MKESYGSHGDRVIRLSARTDIARKSAGATARSFEYVENVFVAATQEYARIATLLENLEAGLAKGRVGDFAGAESALKGLGPRLDELDRHLTEWESRWQQVPLQIDAVQQELTTLRMQVEAAAAEAGAPLPLSDKLASMAQHLERTRSALAAGNPVEAGHLVDDLRIAIRKVGDEATLYISGAGAVTQAERETAALKERLGEGAGAEAVAALAAAEALLPRLRPALAAGKLEPFQADLLQVQKNLAAARSALGR